LDDELHEPLEAMARDMRNAIAPYAERIRQLEREVAERKTTSIGNYKQFHVLLNVVCDAYQELERAEGCEVFLSADKLTAAKDDLIAYIDERK
jgi:hypothetical protein